MSETFGSGEKQSCYCSWKTNRIQSPEEILADKNMGFSWTMLEV